ncbi:C-terminal binding protein [Pseudoclavibacter sp. RFBG4]|uniref:C-terminal binding protein n=1 Tax=Pseudoclavibacter sp. RFBG4 TaxID=2080575 RepID=UPI0015E42A5F|nr:C-terminal binding protein [Pseudoclavibacter sp. RFBG4]
MFHIVKTDPGLIELTPESLEELDGIDYRISELPGASPAELIAHARNADALIIMTEAVNEEVLAGLQHLKIVARPGVGVDSINVEAATRRGVQVTNAPDANFDEVATHALALILDQVRGIAQYDRTMQAGQWLPQGRPRGSQRMRALSLGLVGFGRTAKRLIELVAPFEMRVRVYARPHHAASILEAGAEPASLEEVTTLSDIVSLHIPVSPSTRGIFSERRIRAMKPGAALINVARGGLIDERALADAVLEGRLSGAGLDVFESEPSFGGPLVGVPGITLTPHVAYLSEQAAAEAALTAVGEVGRCLRGEAVRHPVNTPTRTA